MIDAIKKEIESRKTFAIISHPDAGKTTITEQLLLFGGAIRSAGTVKGKKSGKFATSDWMDIEKQRGISVTSSVMQFDFDHYRINILDTPGHQDFSEDTYRTLMAVDSAVMVIDSAKGIEPQTMKLFKVCRMRGIPIFTFINKLDRPGRDPMDLISELEEVLGIGAYPMNWPIGMGKELVGNIDRYNHRIEQYRYDDEADRFIALNEKNELLEPHAVQESTYFDEAMEEINLLDEAGNEFDEAAIAAGELTPVFFGSALANFGVENFLSTFVDFAPAPQPRQTEEGDLVDPTDSKFSGFIFKIQANMNKAHRDRIAFVRICSGAFEKGMNVHLARTGKTIKLNNSTQFMADSQEIVSHAVSGDIIGLYDTGNYQIGDTITMGAKNLHYEKMPQFTPELFMRVSAKNVMKQKHFHKGVEQLVQEGAIQLYKTWHAGDYMLGAVGQLQFEVFEHRMNNEYNSEIIMEPMGKKMARWIKPEDADEKLATTRNMLVRDRYDQPVFLFENEFALRWFNDKNPDVELFELI